MHFGASAVGARRRDAGDAAAHLPGAATKQMPPRRRAPPGWGPQRRWRCYSLLTYRNGYARRSRLASVPGDPSKVYLLFPDRPLALLLLDYSLTKLPFQLHHVEKIEDCAQEER